MVLAASSAATIVVPTASSSSAPLMLVPRGGGATTFLVPPLLLLGVNSSSSSSSSSSKTKQPEQRTSSLSALNQWWYATLPSFLRYFVSGNLGNVVLYCLERLLSWALAAHLLPDAAPIRRDSVSFFVAYWLHIPFQHLLHALLVYGLESINTAAKYWTTLAGMFSALTVASVGSTAFNAFLLSLNLDKTVAFLVTLYSFSIFNYFVIGFIVRKSSSSSSSSGAQSSRSSSAKNKAAGKNSTKTKKINKAEAIKTRGGATSSLFGEEEARTTCGVAASGLMENASSTKSSLFLLDSRTVELSSLLLSESPPALSNHHHEHCQLARVRTHVPSF